MKDEEEIAEYQLTLDKIVNAIKELGEKVEDKAIVQKVLRSLPSRYNAKIFAIEEARDLKILTIDNLHGILTPYEMRIVDEETTKREIVFKATRKEKEESLESDSDVNEQLSELVKKVRKGFQSVQMESTPQVFQLWESWLFCCSVFLYQR